VEKVEPESKRGLIKASIWNRLSGVFLHPYSIVSLAVAFVVSRGITQGELLSGDEPRHAMNGVFLRDCLVDRPWRNPLQYAYEYYAKYPAISFPHWPPFFHFVESIYFLVFGVSVWVSRLAVLSFAFLAGYFWYRIAERQGPRNLALLSAFIFPLLPFMLQYERTTMLEIPALALCLGAIHFWLRFLQTERGGDLWRVVAFLAVALLTKQTAVFLVLFFGLHFLVERRFRLLRRWDVWCALATCMVVVLPWYLFSFRFMTLSYQRGIEGRFRDSATGWDLAYYLKLLPQQLGLVLIVLVLAGFIWSLFRARRRFQFLILWVISCYLCFTLLQEKDIRHTIIWIPPLVYFALLGLEAVLNNRRWASAACVVLALWVLVKALRFEVPKVIGVENVARYVLSQPESDIVYYQGALNGDFIFSVRKLDPEKRHMVARDKQVVATQIVYDRRTILHTPQEVLTFFQNWGIRYAVVDNREPSEDLEPALALFQSDQFERIAAFPIWSNSPEWRDVSLSVYRYRGELRRANSLAVIPMMTIHNDISVDLKRLVGQRWPN
jgi:hypothetical protein